MGQEQSRIRVSSGDDIRNLEDNVRELGNHISQLAGKQSKQLEDSNRIFDNFRLWTETCQSAAQSSRDNFCDELVKAFHKLADLTKLALEATDGRLNHPGNAHILASILETKAAFKVLLEASRSDLKTLGNGSQEAFVQEAIVNTKIEELEEYEIQIKSSYEANENAVSAVRRNLGEAESNLRDAERRLHQRTQELDNIFDGIFTDKSSILRPFKDSVDHEATQVKYHRKYAELAEDLRLAEKRILHNLHEHIRRLEELMEKARKEEHNIIHAKEASSELFSKIYDMEIRFESRDILLDKTDLLRHILQMLHVTIVQNSDEYPSIRAAIYQHFSNHMTAEEIRDLEETKHYLVMDI